MEHNPCDFITSRWDYEVEGKQIRAGEPKNGLYHFKKPRRSKLRTKQRKKTKESIWGAFVVLRWYKQETGAENVWYDMQRYTQLRTTQGRCSFMACNHKTTTALQTCDRNMFSNRKLQNWATLVPSENLDHCFGNSAFMVMPKVGVYYLNVFELALHIFIVFFTCSFIYGWLHPELYCWRTH